MLIKSGIPRNHRHQDDKNSSPETEKRKALKQHHDEKLIISPSSYICMCISINPQTRYPTSPVPSPLPSTTAYTLSRSGRQKPWV